jgi:hypothetical protein
MDMSNLTIRDIYSILGSGYAEESAVDHNTFDMIVTISHPWWGKIYEYKGQFKIKGQA